jgi:NADPH:quinone reductase-like Zn-dependent oxidoreductase
MSRHSRYNRASRSPCGWSGKRADGFGARSGRVSRAGARVIGTVRSFADEETAKDAGAREVVRNDNDAEFKSRVKELAPEGVDPIVEVAFGANISSDVDLLKMNGSIASYATNVATPTIPFWADGVQEHSAVLLRQRRLFEASQDYSNT